MLLYSLLMFPTIIFNDNNWSNFWRNSFTSNNRKFELSFVIFEICQPFETLKESTFESDKGNLFNSLSCLLKLVNCVDDLSWNEKLNPRILLFMVPNLTKQGGSRFTALVYCWLHFYCFFTIFLPFCRQDHFYWVFKTYEVFIKKPLLMYKDLHILIANKFYLHERFMEAFLT